MSTAKLAIGAVFLLGPGQPGRALAQTAPPIDGIVVEGRRLTRPELQQRVTEVVSRLTVLPELGQYARWTRPPCVRVSGVDPSYAGIVQAKIDAAAQAAGLAVAGPGCAPDLLVVFVADSKQAADALARRSSAGLMRSTRTADRRAFLESEQPVRWLYALRKTDSSGVVVGEGNAPAPPGAGAAPVNADAGGFATSRYTSSLIDSNLIVGIRNALILVDFKRAEGYPLESVAAYVARVALAQTPLPPPAVEAPTILSLFDRPPAPRADELSQWDQAYLKALYRVAPNREGWTQRHRIQQQMAAILLGRN